MPRAAAHAALAESGSLAAVAAWHQVHLTGHRAGGSFSSFFSEAAAKPTEVQSKVRQVHDETQDEDAENEAKLAALRRDAGLEKTDGPERTDVTAVDEEDVENEKAIAILNGDDPDAVEERLENDAALKVMSKDSAHQLGDDAAAPEEHEYAAGQHLGEEPEHDDSSAPLSQEDQVAEEGARELHAAEDEIAKKRAIAISIPSAGKGEAYAEAFPRAELLAKLQEVTDNVADSAKLLKIGGPAKSPHFWGSAAFLSFSSQPHRIDVSGFM